MRKKERSKKPASTPDPKPDVLKLKGKWQEAVKQSLQKRRNQRKVGRNRLMGKIRNLENDRRLRKMHPTADFTF